MKEGTALLEVNGLTKRYGSHYAIREVSFSVERGDILGFLGQNGAGKSTTMNIVTGYISATCGSVRLNGVDLMKSPAAYKRMIGYLPEVPPLYPEMTVREYLRFVCEIKDVQRRRIRRHVDEIGEMLNLTAHYGRLIRNLSKGYRQRVGLAQALVGDPEVIILDEPTVGLDPRQMIEMRNLIRWLGQKHTVILSSHVLSEVADVCNRVAIIHQGHIVVQDSMSHLTQGESRYPDRLMIRVQGAPAAARSVLEIIEGVKAVEELQSRELGACDFRLEIQKDTDVRSDVSFKLIQANIPILMLRPVNASLEEIFLHLTSGGGMD